MDRDGSSNVTMPKWPAWVMLAVMAASAYPALTASPPSAVAAEKPAAVDASSPERLLIAN